MNNSRMVRNLMGAALTLLMLIPVPALGITFLGSWRYFSAATGGTVNNVPPPAATDAANNYTLAIGMGMVDPPSNVSKFSVTATRDFQITDPSELIRISHSFGSTIAGGSINVTMTIQRYGVANDPFNFPPFSFTAPDGPAVPIGLNDFSRTGALTQGLYRLSLTITYTRTPSDTSSWNNSSPHTFNFRGL